VEQREKGIFTIGMLLPGLLGKPPVKVYVHPVGELLHCQISTPCLLISGMAEPVVQVSLRLRDMLIQMLPVSRLRLTTPLYKLRLDIKILGLVPSRLVLGYGIMLMGTEPRNNQVTYSPVEIQIFLLRLQELSPKTVQYSGLFGVITIGPSTGNIQTTIKIELFLRDGMTTTTSIILPLVQVTEALVDVLKYKKNIMKKFSELTKINEMKYGQPMYGENDFKQHRKNLLVAASGNDQRVLNDIVDCLTDEQMEKCYSKLLKVYNYTGKVGEAVPPTV